MSENHELRLKIDAAAAKEGSSQFQAAINAMKAAVNALERDSSGAFTRLNKSMAILGKIKLPGVDSKTLSDVDSFVKLQTAVTRAVTDTTRAIRANTPVVKGLAAAYLSAKKDADGFLSSINRVNAALERQVRIAGQARGALRTTSTTTPKTENMKISGAASSADALNMIIRLYNEVGIAAIRSGGHAASGSHTAAQAAREHARAARDATAAVSAQERLELASASAMRSASLEAARLTERLSRIGDVGGILALERALNALRATASSGTATMGTLRTAVSGFADATTHARISLVANDAAQNKAASSAKNLTQQNRAAAASTQAIEREMRSIAGASNATSQALARATGNMRGLENAFSSTFQVGSMFRNMLGSLTLGTFTKSVFEAGNALEQFKVTMEVASGSASAAAGEMQFIDDMTRKLGTSLTSARDSYSKFAISSNLAGVSSKSTQQIFESVSTAMAVLGKGTEDQNLAFLALEQMMSKGTVSSEELRRQLGERLPGAVNIMAKSLGVTTAELQKMLKAGSISSADALPKFAAQLQKEFGPGLNNAMKRAGYSLGTMQGELQRLMETVAESGFMQVLAEQFRNLTKAMQSDSAREAAVKLGEGFAMMAEMGGKSLLYIAENADKLGVIIKGVFAGIITRQLLSFGQAMVTATQQSMAWMVSWGTGAASLSKTEVSTLAYTSALQNNTRALLLNSEAAGASALAQTELGAAQALAARGAVASSTAAVGGMSRMVGALGFVSRGLSVIAPIAGIAIAAMTIIPSMLGDVADAADVSQKRLDAALRRAGVSLDTFKDNAAKGASLINLEQNLSDLNTFSQALKEFKNEASKPIEINQGVMGYAPDMASKLDGLAALKNTSNNVPAAGSWEKDLNVGALAQLHVKMEDIDKMSASGKAATSAIVDMTTAAINGKGSFTELYTEISKSMSVHPDTKEVLTPIQEWITAMASAEVASVELKGKMVNLYGTTDEKFIKGFVDAAAIVANTGEGMDSLNEKIKEAQQTSPQLVSALLKIKSDAMQNVGMPTGQFAAMELDSYFKGSVAEDIIKAQNTVIENNNRVVTSSESVQKSLITMLATPQEESLFAASKNLTYEDANDIMLKIRELGEARTAFQDAPIAPKDVTTQFNAEVQTMPPQARADMQTYTDEVMRQYNALKPLNQSYMNLRSIMASVAVTQQAGGVHLGNYVQQLASAARQNRVVGISTEDMSSGFSALVSKYNIGKSALVGYMTSVVRAASTNDAWARSASGANSALEVVINTAYQIAGGANSGANSVWGLINALRSLFSMSGGIAAGGADILRDMNSQLEIAKATGADKARLQYWATGDGAKFKAESETQIATAKTELANAGSTMERLSASAKLGLASVTYGAYKNVIDRKTTEIFDANESNKGGGGKGGGKGGGGGFKPIDDKKVEADILKRAQALDIENKSLQAVISSTYKSEEAAKLYGEALVSGNGVISEGTRQMLDQIDAAALLNEQLQRVAKDPVREFLASVPLWEEASRTIQGSIVENMSNTLAEFFKTGKLNLADFASSVAGTMADILAKQTTGAILGKFGITGALGGKGGEVASGGQQAGGFMHNAIVSAGQIVSNMFHGSFTRGAQTAGMTMQSGMTVGGQHAAAAQRAAGAANSMGTTVAGHQAGRAMNQGVVSGGNAAAAAMGQSIAGAGGGGGLFGGGGGGIFGTLISIGAGLFSEGGYSDMRGMTSTTLSPSAFTNAPHYAEGTTNTSGIPAVLHPNEAVIPLSRGRKIPIEMKGNPSKGENVTSLTMGDIHIQVQTNDIGDSANAAAMAESVATMVGLKIKEELASQMQYGGMINPRGGR